MLCFFTSDLRKNLTKILCLTVGLAVGFLLVAQIYFMQTVDTFFPAADRIYIVNQHIIQKGEYREYPTIPGATAPGLKRYVPQVEAATRATGYLGKSKVKLDDGRLFDIDGAMLADTCFFDVLVTPILTGDPHEVLAVESECMIPRSLADKIGGDVMGLRLLFPELTEKYHVTVGGVYDDFPLNSTIGNNIYVSMPTTARIMPYGFDPAENWMGTDRYTGYVRLAAGTSPDDISEAVSHMIDENLDREAVERCHYGILLKPLVGDYSSRDTVKTMCGMLAILAVVIMMCAGLNYLLVVIGQLGHRAKEMAIRKCYGTPVSGIFVRVMGESLFFIAVSLGLALLVCFALSDLTEDILGCTPAELFSTGHVWAVEIAVCLGLLIVTGVIPAVIYSRTPVTGAFRVNVRSRRGWKLTLLAVQFFAAGLIACLLITIGRQYRLLCGLDMGFDYENIGQINTGGLSREMRSTLISELKRLGCVEGVSSSWFDYVWGASGNNIWTEGHEDDDFNVADLEWANPDIFDVLGMTFVQGEGFGSFTDSTVNEVVVEERMVEVLQRVFGVESDYIIGERFRITGHGRNPEVTVCGVVKDMRRGGFDHESVDRRPGVIFPTQVSGPFIYVRFARLTPAAMREAQDVIDRVAPASDVYITPWRTEINSLREPVSRFGMAAMVVGITIVIIALVGLIGYTADEVQRRSKEIAVRKVCGTSARAIVRLFCLDILRVALPSLLLGGLAAAEISRRWLMQFTERVTPGLLWMVLALCVLLVLLTAVVSVNSMRVARSNPILHLRSE